MFSQLEYHPRHYHLSILPSSLPSSYTPSCLSPSSLPPSLSHACPPFLPSSLNRPSYFDNLHLPSFILSLFPFSLPDFQVSFILLFFFFCSLLLLLTFLSSFSLTFFPVLLVFPFFLTSFQSLLPTSILSTLVFL